MGFLHAKIPYSHGQSSRALLSVANQQAVAGSRSLDTVIILLTNLQARRKLQSTKSISYGGDVNVATSATGLAAPPAQQSGRAVHILAHLQTASDGCISQTRQRQALKYAQSPPWTMFV